MMTQVLHCPYCQGTDIVRHGTTPEGKQSLSGARRTRSVGVGSAKNTNMGHSVMVLSAATTMTFLSATATSTTRPSAVLGDGWVDIFHAQLQNFVNVTSDGAPPFGATSG